MTMNYKHPIDYPEAWSVIKEKILSLQDACAKLEKEAKTEDLKTFYKGEQQGLHLAFEKIMDQIPYIQ